MRKDFHLLRLSWKIHLTNMKHWKSFFGILGLRQNIKISQLLKYTVYFNLHYCKPWWSSGETRQMWVKYYLNIINLTYSRISHRRNLKILELHVVITDVFQCKSDVFQCKRKQKWAHCKVKSYPDCQINDLSAEVASLLRSEGSYKVPRGRGEGGKAISVCGFFLCSSASSHGISFLVRTPDTKMHIYSICFIRNINACGFLPKTSTELREALALGFCF